MQKCKKTWEMELHQLFLTCYQRAQLLNPPFETNNNVGAVNSQQTRIEYWYPIEKRKDGKRKRFEKSQRENESACHGSEEKQLGTLE